MPKIVNLSFKVPEDIHKKLKVISVLSGRTMSEIIIDFVKKQKVSIPRFDEKPEKTKPIKTAKRKDENPNADEGVIKSEILKHKENGLSLQKIADALQSDGVPSLRGADWRKGTVAGLLKKWERQKETGILKNSEPEK